MTSLQPCRHCMNRSTDTLPLQQHFFPHSKNSLTNPPRSLAWWSKHIITSTFYNERIKSSGSSPLRAWGKRTESGMEHVSPGAHGRSPELQHPHSLQEYTRLPGANNSFFNRPLIGALQNLRYSWALGLHRKFLNGHMLTAANYPPTSQELLRRTLQNLPVVKVLTSVCIT